MNRGAGRWRVRMGAMVLLLALCSVTATYGAAQDRYQGEGRVLGMDESKRMLFLAHGPIPGFMPPMRHGFEVHRVELLHGLKKGDHIRFVLEVQGEVFGISSLEVVEDTE
jgi:Cu/Ag efflux protein CusF